MTETAAISARLSKPCIMVEGKIGMYDLHLPLTLIQATELRDALDRALSEAGR
jgi:hypothetical protein